jgi:DNA polymerase-3 subunit delta'
VRYTRGVPARAPEEARPIPALDLEQPQAGAYLNSLGRDHVPPLLFEGPEGSGKEYTAIEFARRLLCENDDPCPPGGSMCSACRRVSILEHPGIDLIYPTPTQGSNEGEDGDVTDIARILEEKRRDIFAVPAFSKKTSIRIARSRAVIQRANTRPFDARLHVFIFVDAHAMREEAQNALLKLVEEPPPHAVVILTTPSPEGLLYTIRSRCQRVRFFPLKRAVLERILADYYDVDPATATRAAALAQGSVTRARALLDSADLADRDAALGLVTGLMKQPESWAFSQALIGARGAKREGVARVLDEMTVILRDAMAGTPALMINGDIAKDIERVTALWSRDRLPRAIDLVQETRAQVFHANANIDGALADLFLKLRRL